MNWAQLIASLGAGGAFGAGISSLVTWFSSLRKNKAEASEVITRAAIDLLEPLREELEAARSEIRTLRRQIGDISVELEATQRDLRTTRADLHIAQAQLRSLEGS